MLPVPTTAINEDITDVAGIAIYLGMLTDDGTPNMGWVYEKVRANQKNPMPVYRPGKYLKFSKRRVMEWLESTGDRKSVRRPRRRAR